MNETAVSKGKATGLYIDVSRKELDFYLGGQTAVLPVCIDESYVTVNQTASKINKLGMIEQDSLCTVIVTL